MKKSHPLVSIVTPSFNQGSFIRQTLESIRKQHNVQAQSIVMDGGSTDQTVAILRSIHENILWESKRDKGQSEALNKGVLKATGSIIGYLNSDDYYLPHSLETVTDIFKSHPEVVWVCGDCLIVDEAGREMHSFIRLFKRLIRKVYQPWMLTILNPFPQPAVFWRREVIETVGKFNQKLHFTMDYEYWLRIQAQYGKPYMIDRPLAAFRIHTTSKGKTQYMSQFQEEIEVSNRFESNIFRRWLHKLSVACILSAYKQIK